MSFSSGGSHEVLRADYVLNFVDHGLSTATRLDKGLRASVEATGRAATKSGAQVEQMSARQATAWKRAADMASQAQRKIADGQIQSQRKVDSSIDHSVSRMRKLGASYEQIVGVLRRYRVDAEQTAAAVQRASQKEIDSMNRAAAARERMARSLRLGQGQAIHPASTIRSGAQRAGGAARGALGSAGGFILGGLAGYVGVQGIEKAATDTTALAKQAMILNQYAGLSRQSALEFAAVSQAYGLSARTLGMTFRTLGTQVDSALTKPTESNTRAFRQLGITQAEVKQHAHDLGGMLGLVADHLNKMPAGAAKTADASKLLGRNWQALLPMLAQGSQGMRDQLAEAKALGVEMGGNTAQNAMKLHEAMIQLKVAQLGLEVQFTEHILPALLKFVEFGMKVYEVIRKNLGPMFKLFGEAIHTVSGFLKEHTTLMKTLGYAVSGVVAAFVAMKVISTVIGLFRGFGENVRSAVGAVKGLASPLETVKGLFTQNQTAEEKLMATNAQLAEANIRLAATYDDVALAARASAESQALGGGGMAGMGGAGGAARSAERTAEADLAKTRQYGMAGDPAIVAAEAQSARSGGLLGFLGGQSGKSTLTSAVATGEKTAATGGTSLLSKAGGLGGGLMGGAMTGGLILIGGNMATSLLSGMAGGKGTTLGGDIGAFGKGASVGGAAGATIGSVVPGVGTAIGGVVGAGLGASIGGGIHLIGQGGTAGIAGGALTGAGIGTAILPGFGTALGAGIGAAGSALGLWGPSDQQVRGQKLMKETQDKINTANGVTLQNLQARLDASRAEGGLTGKQAKAVQGALTQRGLQLLTPGVQSFGGDLQRAQYAPSERQLLGGITNRLQVAGPTRPIALPGLPTFQPQLTNAQKQGTEMMVRLAAGMEAAGKQPRGTTDRLIADLEKKFGPGLTSKLNRDGAFAMQALDSQFKQKKVVNSVQGLVNQMNQKWPFLIPAAKVGMGNYQQVIVNDLSRLRGQILTAHGQEKQDLINHYNALKKVADQGLQAQFEGVQAAQKKNADEVNSGGKPILDNAKKVWTSYRNEINSMLHQGAIDQKQAHGLMQQNDAAFRGVMNRSGAQLATDAFRNFGHYAGAIGTAAQAAAGANKKGVDAIQSATDQILKSLGASGVPKVKVSGLDAISQGVAGGILGSDATSTAGQRRTATGGRVPGPVGMDTWTLVDPTGSPAAMVGGGEILVANRHTESRVDSMLGYFGTSLGREVERETVPHYAARGGRFAKGGVAGAAASLGQGAAGAAVQYVFPFPKNESFSWNRIDQGQDLQGPPGGPVLAIGPGNVSVASDAFSGFGPFYPVLSLSAGPWAGQSVYYGHSKDTRTGNVNTGDVIGVTQTSANEWTAAPAGWLEFGFTSALGHGNQGQGSEVAPMLHGLAAGHMVSGIGGGGGGVTVPTLKAPGVSGRGANARAVRTSLKKVTDAANKKLQAAAAAASGPGTTGGSLTVLPGPAPPGALQWEVKAVQETDNLAGNSGGGAYGPLIGYSELGSPLGSGVGNALGHLPGMTMMYISANHKTIEAPLVDIGTGSQGGEWTSFPSLVMGLYPKASQALGFGLDTSPWLVDIGRVDRAPLHPASGIPLHAFGGRVGAKAGAHGRNRRGNLANSAASYRLPERALGGRIPGYATGGTATSGGWTFSGGAGKSHHGGSHRGPKPPGTSYHWNPYSGHYEAMTASQFRALENQWYAGHAGERFPSGPGKGKKGAPTSYHWDPFQNQYRAMTGADYRALQTKWYHKNPHKKMPTGPAKTKNSAAAAQGLLDLVTQGSSAFMLGYQHSLDPSQGMAWKDLVQAAITSATAPGVHSGGYKNLFPDEVLPIDPVPSRVKAVLQAADRYVTGHERVKGDDPGFAISRALDAGRFTKGLHHAPYYRSFGKSGAGRWVSTYAGAGRNAFLGVKGHGYLVPASMPHGPGWFREKPKGSWAERHPAGYQYGGRLAMARRRAAAGHHPAHPGHPGKGGKGGKGGHPVKPPPSAPVVAGVGPTVPGYDWATDPAVGYTVVTDPEQIYGTDVGGVPGIVGADLYGTSLDPSLLGTELGGFGSAVGGGALATPGIIGADEPAGGELPDLTDPLTQYGDAGAMAAKSLAYAHAAQGDISKVLHSHALKRVNDKRHPNRARKESAQLGRIRGQLTDPTNMTRKQLDAAAKTIRTDLGQLEHVKGKGKNVKGAIKSLKDSLAKVDYTKNIRDATKTIDDSSSQIAKGGTIKQITDAFTKLGAALDDTSKTSWKTLVSLHDALKKQLAKMPSGSAEAKRLQTELDLVDAQMGKRTGALVNAAETQAAALAKGLTRLQRLMTRQGIDAASGKGAQMLAAYEDQNVKVMENTVKSLRKALQMAKQAGDQAAVDDVTTKLTDALDQLDQAVTDDVDAHRKAIEAVAQDAVDAATHAENLLAATEQSLSLQQQLAGTSGTIGAATQTADYIRASIVPALQGELTALRNQQSAALSVGDQKLADQIAEAIASKQNDILQAQLDAQNAIKDATQATAQNIAELGGQLGVSYQNQTLPDFAGMLTGV